MHPSSPPAAPSTIPEALPGINLVCNISGGFYTLSSLARGAMRSSVQRQGEAGKYLYSEQTHRQAGGKTDEDREDTVRQIKPDWRKITHEEKPWKDWGPWRMGALSPRCRRRNKGHTTRDSLAGRIGTFAHPGIRVSFSSCCRMSLPPGKVRQCQEGGREAAFFFFSLLDEWWKWGLLRSLQSLLARILHVG